MGSLLLPGQMTKPDEPVTSDFGGVGANEQGLYSMIVYAGFVDGTDPSFTEKTGSDCKPYSSWYVWGGKVVPRRQEGLRVADQRLREVFF